VSSQHSPLCVAVAMNERLRNALTDAAYAQASARLRPEAPLPTTDEWVEPRAASAVLQTQGGHFMANVYTFLSDTSTYPEALGPPPEDLRQRLLFAYVFILETGGDP
jgi:hypothetical protein